MNRGDQVNVRRYILDSEEKWCCGWGIVWISDDGLFCAHTDYGDWLHYWPSRHRGDHYTDMRRFILAIEPSYLMGKLGLRTDYDEKSTLLEVKRHILSGRRDGTYDKKEAKEEWDRLDYFDYLTNEHDFNNWVSDTEICDAWEFRCMEYPADLKAFAERLMPRLKELIREEIERERLRSNPLLKEIENAVVEA